MFFSKCKTIEALKKLYKELAMKWHPDRPGGDEETMKSVNAEYDKMFDRVKDIHEGKDGKTWEAFGEKKTNETSWMFRDILDKLIKMHGIVIEICGTWLWLTGNTWSYHERLSELGCEWSKSKKAWYWSWGLGEKGKRRSRYSLDNIRQIFGSVQIDTDDPLTGIAG
jgi:curved DNA-binding protein CbpA